jgi:hypothetical protein
MVDKLNCENLYGLRTRIKTRWLTINIANEKKGEIYIVYDFK